MNVGAGVTVDIMNGAPFDDTNNLRPLTPFFAKAMAHSETWTRPMAGV